MSSRTLLAGLAGLLGAVTLSVAGTACADTAFLPGLYETRVSYPDDGAGVETTRECLTPAEAKQESLERRLAEAVQDGNCRFAQRSIAGGKFTLVGTCVSEGAKSSVRQTGTYTPTTMAMNMRMTVVAGPGAPPVSVDMVMTSRRLATICPAGSDQD